MTNFPDVAQQLIVDFKEALIEEVVVLDTCKREGKVWIITIGNVFFIAARVLATYLIPGCVGRGVRLGSENSSGGAGADLRRLEIWELGNLGIWRSGDLEIQKCGVQKIKKVKIIKIQIHSAKNFGKV